MDLRPGRRFFLDPELTFHRRYEALRAFFVEARPLAEVAARFGYKPTALNVMISRFNSQVRNGLRSPLFVSDGRGRPPGQRRCEDLTGPEEPALADQRLLNLESGRRLPTRNAGVFLFLVPDTFSAACSKCPRRRRLRRRRSCCRFRRTEKQKTRS